MSETSSAENPTPQSTEPELFEGDTITVMSGIEKFTPIDYHTFAVGGHSVTTTVQPGETAEAAFKRAMNFLARMKRDEFIQERTDYYQRLGLSRPA